MAADVFGKIKRATLAKQEEFDEMLQDTVINLNETCRVRIRFSGAASEASQFIDGLRDGGLKNCTFLTS